MQIDFDAVILAHVGWKRKLQAHLTGTAPIDLKTIASDTHCELGKWLEANPSLRTMPEFAALKKAHAEFHQTAAEVARRGANTSPAETAQLLNLSSPFGKASGLCVKAITDLRDRMATKTLAKV